MAPRDPFEQFVAAVHRRAVGWGVVERVGLCLVAAAGVAGVLTAVAGWQGVAVGAITVGLMVLAIVVGIAWGVIRRPSRLDAILQADQQLNLADLLSTALLSPRDDFGQAVRAMADRACARHSPSEVTLNRLGARAWGGIGLAWAMVLVLTLLAGQGRSSQASDATAANRITLSAEDPSHALAAGRQAVGGREATSDDASHIGPPADSQVSRSSSPATPNGPPSHPSDAAGQHASQTDHTDVDPIAAHSADSQNTANPQGTPAAGNGLSSPANTVPGLTGDTATARPPDRAAAPWTSDHWPTDRAAALQAVQDGRVPDAYRDLVRDYFSK